MATYIIGDLQGCFEPLQRLLQHIRFDPEQDRLWFCGDLIARGPHSLECLLFVKQLGDRAITVLGNHDLHFLACHFGISQSKPQDKLQALFDSPLREELVHWLCQQPLLHLSADQRYMMVHAGLAPEWQLTDAMDAANNVQLSLRNEPKLVLSAMYGNKPERWSDARTTAERWRFTINSFTRMRFCRPDGSLELKEKGHPRNQATLVPWYEFWRTKMHTELFFGHWAALNGYSPVGNIHALDTGCVWGNALTAYCIETQQRYSVAAAPQQRYS